jgi:tRNA_anti-like
MRKNLKIALIVTGILALAGAIAGFYLYNLKPKDLGKVKPDFVLTSSELQKSFEENETSAGAKYINKIIEVSGEISSVQPGENNSMNISLKTNNSSSSVICTFPYGSEPGKYKEGSQITVRGECSGYLMDVLLNNCVIAEGPK